MNQELLPPHIITTIEDYWEKISVYKEFAKKLEVDMWTVEDPITILKDLCVKDISYIFQICKTCKIDYIYDTETEIITVHKGYVKISTKSRSREIPGDVAYFFRKYGEFNETYNKPSHNELRMWFYLSDINWYGEDMNISMYELVKDKDDIMYLNDLVQLGFYEKRSHSLTARFILQRVLINICPESRNFGKIYGFLYRESLPKSEKVYRLEWVFLAPNFTEYLERYKTTKTYFFYNSYHHRWFCRP